MHLEQMVGCCGMGVIKAFQTVNIYPPDDIKVKHKEAIRAESPEILADVIIHNRDKNPMFGYKKYELILATTPDKDDWWFYHMALALAGFVPTYSAKSFHGNYRNILWVFERNPND